MRIDQQGPLIDKIKETLDQMIGPGWALTCQETTTSYESKLDVGTWDLTRDPYVRHTSDNLDRARGPIASFHLYPMINCCGICVSTGSRVHKDFQKLGLGTLLNTLRIDIARNLGYGLLLCTDVESNEPQRKILQKNGWRDIHKFINPRTKNTVIISCINL